MHKEIISRRMRDQLILQAREFRKNPTLAEARVWDELRNHRLGGLKFRRQHIIYMFIVDFYCPVANLVIEIDGPIHQDQKEYDIDREEYLQALGYQVIRFSNDEVAQKMDLVLAGIYEACMQRIELLNKKRKSEK